MLTKSDKAWIIQTFDERFEMKFERKFDQQIAPLFAALRNDIAKFKDEIAGLYHNIDQDHTILGHHVREQGDVLESFPPQLRDHEHRISILETKQKAAPTTT